MICIFSRASRSSLPLSLVTSSPSRKIWPEVLSWRWMMVRPRVDLPQPDSPTTPRVFPFSMVKVTSSTAWSSP